MGDISGHEIDGEYEEIEIDTRVREQIFAFPPHRVSFIHNHITFETNYEKFLKKYPVPKEVQVTFIIIFFYLNYFFI